MIDPHRYSVVIPVYNSQDIVAKTVTETVKFFEERSLNYEIVLVNDKSPDNSWEVIDGLAKQNPNVVAIDLLKNYGQHSAVFCGIKHISGDFVITMDDDLQNPPSEIAHLISKIHEGYDAVFAEFKKKRHSFVRRLGTKVIDFLNVKVFDKPADLKLTNFRIFSKDVAERIADYRTSYPYIPGLVLLCSSKQGNVLCEHHAREVGSSNYSMVRILKLVARLLFNYSSYPLKLLTSIGFFVSFVSLSIGLFFLIKNLTTGVQVQGWTTLLVLLSFVSSFIILMLGIVGEYLARMLNQMSANSYQVKSITKSNG